MRIASAFLLGGVLLAATARAAEPSSAVPRFASFASDKVYMREGPTYRHPILWVYHRRGLPVEIVAQYDVWRKVRDADGTTGWVHASMIAERRTVVVTAKRLFAGAAFRRPARTHSCLGEQGRCCEA